MHEFRPIHLYHIQRKIIIIKEKYCNNIRINLCEIENLTFEDVHTHTHASTQLFLLFTLSIFHPNLSSLRTLAHLVSKIFIFLFSIKCLFRFKNYFEYFIYPFELISTYPGSVLCVLLFRLAIVFHVVLAVLVDIDDEDVDSCVVFVAVFVALPSL